VPDRWVLADPQEVHADLGDLHRPLRSTRGAESSTGAMCSRPLEEVLVRGSKAHGAQLKERLYAAGLKTPACELCGQDELWRGRRMSLILDHVNGDTSDNRLENLRVVCPNCNATLDTHCGRNARVVPLQRECALCGRSFRPKYASHRYCSRSCGVRYDRRGRERPGARKVERPPHVRLRREVAAMGYRAVGRRYGVSDNAVRKLLRRYEAEAGTEQLAPRYAGGAWRTSPS
jgi:hypothetical protein